MQKNMKKQGISIIGIIVFLALVAFIAWGLNYIITKDFVVLRTPITPISNVSADAVVPATSTTTPAQTKPVATPTPTKTPEPTKTPVTPVAPTSSALTVTFTNKGFSPTSLTVIKGQTVTFKNESSNKMWVAANPFPTSSEYPAFNEKTGVASGASWSFTFDKTGVWFYHNHYSPAQGAKIVVNAK